MASKSLVWTWWIREPAIRNRLHLKKAWVKMWKVEAVQPVATTTWPILQTPRANIM